MIFTLLVKGESLRASNDACEPKSAIQELLQSAQNPVNSNQDIPTDPSPSIRSNGNAPQNPPPAVELPVPATTDGKVAAFFQAWREKVQTKVETPESKKLKDKILSEYGVKPISEYLVSKSVSAALKFYLRWENPTYRDAKSTPAHFADIRVGDDLKLAQIFGVSSAENRGIQDMIFNDLLKTPEGKKKIIAVGDILTLFFDTHLTDNLQLNPEQREILLSSMTEIKLNSNGNLETTADFPRLDQIEKFNQAYVESFNNLSANLVDENGDRPDNTVVRNLLKEAFSKRLKKIQKDAKGALTFDLVLNAIQITPADLEESKSTATQSSEFDKMLLMHAHLSQTENYNKSSAYRLFSSAADHSAGKIQAYKDLYNPPASELAKKTEDSEIKNQESKILSATVGNTTMFEGTPLINFGALPISQRDREILQKQIKNDIKGSFSLSSNQSDPGADAFKDARYADPRQFLPKGKNKKGELEAPYYENPYRIQLQAHASPAPPASYIAGGWRIPLESGGVRIFTDQEFETYKTAAMNAEVEKRIEAMLKNGVEIDLRTLLSNADRYDTQGFFTGGKIEPKTGKWRDPFLRRHRDKSGGEIDFKGEIKNRYDLSLQILRFALNKPDLKSIPITYSDLLFWPEEELTALLTIKSLTRDTSLLEVDASGRLKRFDSKQLATKASDLLGWKLDVEKKLGFFPDIHFSNEKELLSAVEKINAALKDKESLAPGIPLVHLGCLEKDGKLVGGFLPEGEVKPLSLTDFRKAYREKKEEVKAPLFKSANELVEKIDSCMAEVKKERNDLIKSTTLSLQTFGKKLFSNRLKAYIRYRFQIEDYLDQKAGKAVKTGDRLKAFEAKLKANEAQNLSQEQNETFLLNEWNSITAERFKEIALFNRQLIDSPDADLKESELKELAKSAQKTFDSSDIQFLRQNRLSILANYIIESPQLPTAQKIEKLEAYLRLRYAAEDYLDQKEGKKISLGARARALDAALARDDFKSKSTSETILKALEFEWKSFQVERMAEVSDLISQVAVKPQNTITDSAEQTVAVTLSKAMNQDELLDLNSDHLNLLLNDQYNSAEKIKLINLSHFSLSELDALHFLSTRYGWNEVIFAAESTDGMGLRLFDWLNKAASNKIDSGKVQTLSILDSYVLLNASHELAVASGIIPTLWGDNWKATLENINKAPLTGVNLRQIGNYNSIPIIETLRLHQDEASRYFTYDNIIKSFRPTREVKPVFDLEKDSLESLARWNIPTDPKHLQKLTEMAAVFKWDMIKEAYLKNMKDEKKSQKEQDDKRKEIEEYKNGVHPDLVKFYRQNQNLKNYHTLAERMKITPEKDNTLARKSFSGRSVFETNSQVSQSLQAGLVSLDVFLDDFFADSKNILTKEIKERLESSTPGSADITALNMIGFDTNTKSFQSAIAQIKAENKPLAEELLQQSQLFLKAGRELQSSFEQGGLSRDDFKKILYAANQREEIMLEIIGKEKNNIKEGSSVSSTASEKILSAAKVQLPSSKAGRARAAKQLDSLRALMSSSQVLFANFHESLSTMVARYSIPLLFEEIRLNAEKSPLGEEILSQPQFQQNLISSGLERASELSNLGSLIDLNSVSAALADATLNEGFKVGEFESEVRKMFSYHYDLNRLLYGKSFDPVGFNFYKGLEGNARTSGSDTDHIDKILIAKINEIRKRQHDSVDRISNLLTAKLKTLPETHALGKFLQVLAEGVAVKKAKNAKGEPTFEISSALKLNTERNEKDQIIYKGTLSDLVSFAKFTERPLSADPDFLPIGERDQSYAVRYDKFEEQYKNIFKNNPKFADSYETRRNQGKLQTSLDRLGQKRSISIPLKNRLEGLKDFLSAARAQPQFNTQEVQMLFEKMESENKVNLNNFFLSIYFALQTQLGKQMPDSIWADKEAAAQEAINKLLQKSIETFPADIQSNAQIQEILKAIKEAKVSSFVKLDSKATAEQKAAADPMNWPSFKKAFPQGQGDEVKSIYQERDDYFKNEENQIGNLIEDGIDRLLIDPNGKKFNIAGRFAPYAYRFQDKDLNASVKNIHSSLMTFISKQEDSFYNIAQRSDSLTKITEDLYGYRYPMLKARISEGVEKFEKAIHHLLETENISRLRLRDLDGARLNTEQMESLLSCTYTEASKKISEKITFDTAFEMALNPAEISNSCLKDFKEKDDLLKSEAFKEQLKMISSRASVMTDVLNQAGALAMQISPENLRKTKILPRIILNLKDFSRVDNQLGISMSKLIEGLNILNKEELTVQYEDLKAKRETRQRHDSSWYQTIPGDVGSMIVHSGQSLWEETYRLGIENLAFNAAWAMTGWDGKEKFDSLQKFFGQYSASHFTPERIQNLAEKKSHRIPLIGLDVNVYSAQDVGDGVGLALTLMTFGAGKAVTTLARETALESLATKVFKDSIAEKVLVQTASGFSAATEGGITAAKTLLRRPTTLSVQEAAIQAYEKSIQQLSKGSIWQKEIRLMGQAPAKSSIAKTIKALGDETARIPAGTQTFKQTMAANARAAKQIATAFGTRIGLDSAWLAAGGVISLLATYQNLGGENSASMLGQGTWENMKFLTAFILTMSLTHKMPWVNRTLNAALMSSIFNDWAKNGVIYFDTMGESRRYTAYLKADGTFDQMALRKNPDADAIFKEYQDDTQAKAKFISASFLVALIGIGPKIGQFADRTKAKGMELSENTDLNSGLISTLGGAYGSRPDRLYDYLVQFRTKRLLEKEVQTARENNASPRPEALIKKDAEAEIQKQFWYVYQAAFPEARVTSMVALWKLSGQYSEGMRNIALKNLKENFNKDFHADEVVDGLPGLRTSYGKERKLTWKEVQEKFNKAWDEGLRQGDEFLARQISEMTGGELLGEKLKIFAALNQKLDEVEVGKETRSLNEVLNDVLDSFGGVATWKTDAGQLFLHRIIIPRMIAAKNRVELGVLFDGAPNLLVPDSQKNPRFSADMFAKLLNEKIYEAGTPAVFLSYPAEAGGVAKISYTTRQGSIEILTDAQGQRFLKLPESDKPILIPEHIQIVPLNSGRLKLISEKKSEEKEISSNGHAVTAELAAFDSAFKDQTTAPLSLMQNLPKHAESYPTRVVEFKLREGLKKEDSSIASIKRKLGLQKEKRAAIVVDLNSNIEQAFIGNNTVLIRYKGKKPVNFLMPDPILEQSGLIQERWKIESIANDGLTIRDQYHQRIKIDFANDKVEVFKEDSRTGEMNKIKQYEQNGKDMTIQQFKDMMENFPGLLPTEIMIGLNHMNFNLGGSTLTVASKVEIAKEMQEKELIDSLADLNLGSIPRDRLTPQTIQKQANTRIEQIGPEKSREEIERHRGPELALIKVPHDLMSDGQLSKLSKHQMSRFIDQSKIEKLESKMGALDGLLIQKFEVIFGKPESEWTPAQKLQAKKTFYLSRLKPEQYREILTEDEIAFIFRMTNIENRIRSHETRALRLLASTLVDKAETTLSLTGKRVHPEVDAKANDLIEQAKMDFVKSALEGNRESLRLLERAISREELVGQIDVSKLSQEQKIYLAQDKIPTSVWEKAEGKMDRIPPEHIQAITEADIRQGASKDTIDYRMLVGAIVKPEKVVSMLTGKRLEEVPNLKSQIQSFEKAKDTLK